MSKNILIKDEEYKRLKQIETLFFYMLEHTSDFIYFKDKDFKFTYVSQIFADLTRHTNWQDLAGKTDFDVFDFEHASHYRSIDSEVIEGKNIDAHQESYYDLEGQLCWVSTSKSALPKIKNESTGLFGISRDITELKRIDKKLRQSEERFREMADLLPGAIIETDTELNIAYINRQGLKLLNYSDEDFAAGLNGLDLIHPDDREKVLKRVADRLDNKPLTTTEYRVLGKGNNYSWVLANASQICKEDQITGFRIVFTDITKRKQAEKEREKLINELQIALKEIKTLKGIIPICSHCKKIRDDAGYWNILESYIQKNSNASFSHGMCPECSDELYGSEDWYDEIKKQGKFK